MLYGVFGDFPDIVVPLLVTQTRETQCRLTTTSVLLRKVDSELVDHFSRVSSNRSEEGAVTIHDDKAELGV